MSLISDIEAFLERTEMEPYRFGMLAARNGRLLERLRSKRVNGRPSRVWPETEEAIRAFMATHEATQDKAAVE